MLYVAFHLRRASVRAPGPSGGFADSMNIIKIILRIFGNFVKDLPLSPRKLRVRYRLRRAWRVGEVERLDRI